MTLHLSSYINAELLIIVCLFVCLFVFGGNAPTQTFRNTELHAFMARQLGQRIHAELVRPVHRGARPTDQREVLLHFQSVVLIGGG